MQMSPKKLLVTAAVLITSLVSVTAGSPQGRALVSYDFTGSAHGWLISGDTGSTFPELNTTGGNPGGFLSNVDEALGETWYFVAPGELLRQLPAAAESGTLSYDLRQSVDEPGFLDDDVVIVGPAGRLSYRFRATPGVKWTSFSVSLSASAGWRWNWNSHATADQIRSVLTNPTSLEIRGEYHTGPDEGGLDNVRLRSAERAKR